MDEQEEEQEQSELAIFSNMFLVLMFGGAIVYSVFNFFAGDSLFASAFYLFCGLIGFYSWLGPIDIKKNYLKIRDVLDKLILGRNG